MLLLVVMLLPSDITPFFSKDASLNLLDSFYGSSKNIDAESQDLAKRKFIWQTEICPL